MDNNIHNYKDSTSQKADNLFFNHRPFRLWLLEKMTVIFFFALVGAATGRAILAILCVAQWMMLPLWSSRTRFWILAGLLIWLLFMWVETFLSFRLNVLGFAAAVAFVGLLAGSLQWYILRRFPRAEWLIPISVMSVLISDLMLPLLRSIYILGYINPSGIYFPTRIHFIYWVVMGTAIGWVLKNAYQTQLEHTD